MKTYTKYLTLIYIKKLIIVFLSLEFFYVGLDLLSHIKSMPSSANLQILYVSYKFLEAITLTLPISLIFAMIFTKLALIKSNELVSMLSLGISRNKAIKPIFLISILFTIVYISLNFTDFTYAKEYAKNIIKYSQVSTSTNDILLKNFNEYIYIKKLSPSEKKAYGVKIFELENNQIKKRTTASYALFNEEEWILHDVKVTSRDQNLTLGNKILKTKNIETIGALKDFKPKIIENLFKKSDQFSIIDAISTIVLFDSQNINTDKMKSALYSTIIFPFFAPFLVLIFFYFIPLSGRFFNIGVLSSFLISFSLIVWAILFIFIQTSKNGVILPEIGIILPILFMLIFAFYLYHTNKSSSYL